MIRALQSKNIQGSISRVDLVLFVAILWGPIRVLNIDPGRTPEFALQGVLDGNSILEISLWLIIGIRACYLWRDGKIKDLHEKPIRTFSGAVGLYLIFGLVALFSAIYSPAPLLSAFRACQVLVCTFYMLMLIRQPTLVGLLLKVIFLFFGIRTAYNMIMYFAVPSVVGHYTQEGYRLLGGYPFNRDFGLAAVVSIIFCLSRFLNRKFSINEWCFFLIGITALLLSRVRSFLVGLTCAFIVTLLVFYRKWILLIVICGIVFVLILAAGMETDVLSFVVRNPDTFTTLSRRTETWSILSEAIAKDPILGNGYAASSRIFLNEWLIRHINIGDAHNAWVESLVSVGFLGTLPLCLCVFLTFVNLAKLPHGELHFQMIMLLNVLIAGSFVSVAICELSPLFVFLLVSVEKLHLLAKVPLEKKIMARKKLIIQDQKNVNYTGN